MSGDLCQRVTLTATKQVVTLSQRGVPGPPGAPGDGSGAALPPGGNPNDVVTKTAGGAAWQPPRIDWNSTNW